MPTDVAGIYDRLGAGYDRLSGMLSSVGVNRLRTELLGRASGEVLEIAVGSGVNLRRYPSGVRVTGIDLSGNSLLAARLGADEAGVNFAGVRGDAAALTLAAASVDTVVCTMAACVFEDPAAVFGEVHRVLQPLGRMLLLEHVRPAGRVGRAMVRTIKPITTRALGCHPDRETLATLHTTGFETTLLGTAARGLFVVVEARPR